MNENITNVLDKLKAYEDKIFYCPWSISRIESLEEKLRIKFPDDYYIFLNQIGLFQDLISSGILNKENDLLIEKRFINNVVRKSPELYFAFGRTGFGDLWALKDKNQNDDFIYKVYHSSGKVTNTKKTFYNYISKAVNKAIKSYKKRKYNKDKRWCVQFTFRTQNENDIYDSLKNEYNIDILDEWKFIRTSPIGVKEFQRMVKISDHDLIFSKQEFPDTNIPLFSFDFEEPVLKICNGSEVEKMDKYFSQKLLGYKIVNYGIL